MAGVIGRKARTSRFMAVPERPALDLNHVAFDHKVRGIRIIGTWLFSGDNKGPCLVLLQPGVPMREAIPCVVPLSNAWRWTEELGDPLWAAITATAFAPALGMSPLSESNINKILDVVRERLTDLLKMRPTPQRERRIMGDVTFTTGDGRLIEKDITDDV